MQPAIVEMTHSADAQPPGTPMHAAKSTTIEQRDECNRGNFIAPQYLSKMTNEIANNALKQTINIDIVAKNGFILLGLYISSAVLTYLSSFLLTGVTQKYANALRKSISENKLTAKKQPNQGGTERYPSICTGCKRILLHQS